MFPDVKLMQKWPNYLIDLFPFIISHVLKSYTNVKKKEMEKSFQEFDFTFLSKYLKFGRCFHSYVLAVYKIMIHIGA